MQPTPFLWLFLILSFTVNSDIYSCPRIRKAWHLTTDEEKQLFISGIHRINDQGKMKHFGLTHHHIIDSFQAHFTAEFFAWHRYFLWEFENQIRSLGEEYECFSLPYWDITTDSGLFSNAYIFNSGLGGIGNVENDDCVDIEDNGAWSRDSYPLQHICHETKYPMDNPSNGCCLKRAAAWMDLSGVSSYTQYIKYYNNFGAHDGFRWTTFGCFHGEVHGFVGGVWANYTHMISRYSSEDPLFYLLHTWLDYIFVVWKQCWGYNQIDTSELDKYPAAYFPFPTKDGIPSSGLDDKLYYVAMDDITWWESKKYNPTARTLWNEQDWNIKYERGTFIARSHLTALCTNPWDTDILLENSQQTMDMIEELRANDGESEVDRYQHRTWEYIKKLMDDENMKKMYNEEDYLQSWKAKTCNFQRQRIGKEPCYIPQEYEKCTKDDLERKDEITIDELLKKEGVTGNDCLEEVRINTFPFAKAMGMIYELCMGELDKYHICDAPNIDFMIDLDDDVYYNKLIKNKQKMKEEKDKDNDNDIKQTNNKQEELPVIGGNVIGNYPSFGIVGYLMVMFVIGGCAFIVMIWNCCKDFNSKLSHSESYQMKSKLNYGSMVEML